MTQIKTFPISINEEITLQTPNNISDGLTGGWVLFNQIWNEEQAIHTIKSVGVSPFIFTDGIKSVDNIKYVNSIMLNLNSLSDDKNFDEWKNIIIAWGFTAILFSSENDRLRIWFPLVDPISSEQFTNLIKELINKYEKINENTLSKIQYYRPSPVRKYYFHRSGKLCDANIYFVKESVVEIPKLNLPKSSKFFSQNSFVVLPDGLKVTIKDIKDDKTKIYCAYCDTANKKLATLYRNEHGIYRQICNEEGGNCRNQKPEEYKHVFKKLNLFYSNLDGRITTIRKKDNRYLVHQFYSKDSNWNNWCNNNGLHPSCESELERYDLTFNPYLPFGVNGEDFNMFHESDLITEAKKNKLNEDEATLDYLKLNTPFIYRILDNLLGKDEYIQSFLNWIMYASTVKKTHTGWLISSCAGAGKGTFYQHILAPLIGEEYVYGVGISRMMSTYNKLDENKIFKIFEESKITKASDKKIKEWLKTESGKNDTIIESKGKDAIRTSSFMHFIILTNEREKAFELDSDDRRFTVIRNMNAVKITPKKWGDLTEMLEKIKMELPFFARYMVSFRIDEVSATTNIDTELRKQIINENITPIQIFVKSIKEGSWDELDFESIEGARINTNKTIDITEKEFIQECNEFGGIRTTYFKPLVLNYFGIDNKDYMKYLHDIKKLGLSYRNIKPDVKIWYYETKQKVDNVINN